MLALPSKGSKYIKEIPLFLVCLDMDEKIPGPIMRKALSTKKGGDTK
jgi:hypothetical protein